jgi:outer membrane protein OmpA-like peptidoglycan-associated protein
MRQLACLLVLFAVPALAQWPSIDTPLPRQGGGERDAALLISIADYAFLPDVAGAKENAAAWYQHLTTTRGVPATQVTWLQDTDATLEGVQDALAELPKKVKPGGTLWVLFIGHGAPSQDGTDGVLVGADAQNVVRSLYARSLPRQKLLDALEAGPHARVVLVLDACFSGQSSAGAQLATGTMPTLPEKEFLVKARKPVVVLSAGTSRQFAGALPGLARPAFSYLALGALRGWADDDHDGSVTANEVVTFSNAVMGTTLRGRQQTPQLNPPEASTTVLGTAGRNEALELNQVVLWLQTGSASGVAKVTAQPLPNPESARSDEPVATASPGLPEALRRDLEGALRRGEARVEVANGQLLIQTQVRFLTGKPTIASESEFLLAQLASAIASHPEIRSLRVEGHTDANGREESNVKLSQDRADAVRKALIARGVAAQRLSAKGFGGAKPIASNRTAAGREANRRIELVVEP